MEVVLQIIREFGFPIFMCLWFMFRHERRLAELTNQLYLLHKRLRDDALLSDSSEEPALLPEHKKE